MHAEFMHHGRSARVVHRHLGGPVDLKAGIHVLNQAHEPDVLYDGSVDAAIDAGSQVIERVLEFTRFRQDVEREVHTPAVAVRDETGLREVVEGELRALVPRVELLDTEIHGVGAVGDGGADGVERSGGGEEFRA